LAIKSKNVFVLNTKSKLGGVAGVAEDRTEQQLGTNDQKW